MKRLMAAAILAAFIGGIIFANIKVTDMYFKKAEDLLSLCETEYREGNKKSAAQTAADLEEYWHDSERVLIIFLNRNGIDEIAETLNRLSSYAQSESDAQFLCESTVCAHLLEDMLITERELFY